jgi:hypothetical protein
MSSSIDFLSVIMFAYLYLSCALFLPGLHNHNTASGNRVSYGHKTLLCLNMLGIYSLICIFLVSSGLCCTSATLLVMGNNNRIARELPARSEFTIQQRATSTLFCPPTIISSGFLQVIRQRCLWKDSSSSLISTGEYFFQTSEFDTDTKAI